MSENLTDADTFDTPIQMPTSGETISAADLRDKAIQKLANRTYYNSLDIIDNAASVAAVSALLTGASYDISGTTLSLGATATLAENFASTGFVLATNLVTFPAVGQYRISVTSFVYETVNVANPFPTGIKLVVGGTTLASLPATRFSAGLTTSDAVAASGSVLANITNTSTQTLKVTAGITGGASTTFFSPVGDENKLCISYVGANP